MLSSLPSTSIPPLNKNDVRYPPPLTSPPDVPLQQLNVAPIQYRCNILTTGIVIAVSIYHRSVSPSIRIQRPIPVYHRSKSSRYFSNLKDDVDKDIDGVDKEIYQEQLNNDDDVTIIKRIRVISYRSTLFISAILLITSALFDSNFLMGTGIDSSTFLSIVDTYLPFAAGVSLLLAPVQNRFIQVVVISLGLATCITGSKVLSILSLMFICIREIIYFGLAFKWEAFISLILLPLLLISDDYDMIAAPLSALSISVLAVGKVFEPIEEDVKTNSEFLAE